ncbi:MAG: patatin-like phospholipase family protein [Fulvimarina manganoxydans]|uniref:patatin-like phospholipase family protein n=1 Tax=Fulvimarina manganoxydans TaxID=937218 RepID=UPI0023526B2A|nr:patatin-like phospholipase family protein [Fulvimarina manganoxydans]MCK5930834.1 patatin-like phospholipase family protein [Fulvimarina manganoxydans]
MFQRVLNWSDPASVATDAGSQTIITDRATSDGPPAPNDKDGIALALGGGAARGWAHIGVLRALDEAGIRVSMIAGTSIGALVGGCYLAGKLDELESFARSLTRRGMLRFLDFQFGGGGLIGGMRLSRRLTEALADMQIEDLGRPFVAVATEARSGHEVWLDRGSLILAMRSSYALPGVFEPVSCGGRRLLDGALVNPVPVNVCRMMEERLVVAVNLNYDLFGRAAVVRMRASEEDLAGTNDKSVPGSPQQRRETLGMARAMVDAFNIIQDRISRSRLAGDPPDLTLQPRVRDIGLSEFHRAAEAIDFGYEVATARIGEIRRMAEELGRHRV